VKGATVCFAPARNTFDLSMQAKLYLVAIHPFKDDRSLASL
jgi:hypothetical protein